MWINLPTTMKLALTFVLLMLTSTTVSAAVILWATGPATNATGIFPFNELAFSFTVGRSDTNVAISPDLIGSFSGTPYLMSQIGPGTTVANQIATGPFTSASGFLGAFQTVFQTVTVPGPGTYFVVLSTAQSTPPQGLNETNSPMVVADTGASPALCFSGLLALTHPPSPSLW